MRRLHPRSVVRKALASGGQLAAFALFVTLTSGEQFGLGGPGAAIGLAAVGLAVGVVYRVAYYYRFAYDLTDEELIVTSGVFARKKREIPLSRVQNVDIRRPFLTRALGLAIVSFETAGGSTTEATLDAVSASEADRLQREASPSARNAGEPTVDPDTDDETEAAPSDDPRQVYAISDGELRLLSLVSFRPGALAIPFFGVPFGGDQILSYVRRALGVLGVELSTVAGLDLVVLAGVGLTLFAAYLFTVWVVSAVLTYLRYYGFRLERQGDELRYERGLIGRYSGTIPLDKVQTVTIGENLVARRLGYAKLAVETAGYAPGSNAGGSETTVPLGARERVLELARDVLAASDHTGHFEAGPSPLADGSGPVESEPPAGPATESAADRPVVDPSFDRPEPVARKWYRRRYLLAVALLTAAVSGVSVGVGGPALAGLAVVPLSVLAPFAARKKWRHRGYHETPWALLTRQGFWRRRTRIVPSFRLQTVIRTRTVFQRRWGVASVTADTASSASLIGGDATVHDIDPDGSQQLSDRLVAELTESLAARKRRELAARRSESNDSAGDAESASATSDASQPDAATEERPEE